MSSDKSKNKPLKEKQKLTEISFLNNNRFTAVRLLIVIILSIFTVETIVMVLLEQFDYRLNIAYILADSLLLVALLSPLLYFILFRPMQKLLLHHQKMEDDLKDSEEHFRTLTETAGDAIIGVTENDLIYLWNNKAEELFGYTAAEARGKQLHQLIVPPAYRADAYRGMETFFKTGRGRLINNLVEVMALHRDGSEFPVEVSISALKTKESWRAVGIIRDMSERNKMVAEMKRVDARLEYIMATSPAIIYSCRVEQEQFIPTYVSSNIKKYLGFEPGEVLGRSEWWPGQLHPDEREQVFKNLESGLLSGDIYQHEYRLRNREGEYIWIQDTLNLIRDSDGNLTEFVGSWADITEEKKATEEVRFFSEVMSNLAEGINIVRKVDLTIIYANGKFEEMFGYEPGELNGQNVSILNAPGETDSEKTTAAILKELNEKGSWRGEVKNITRDGRIFWTLASVIPFAHETHGDIWISVQSDISELKKAQQLLIHSAKLASIGEMGASIAHEINNPMTSVLGFTTYILDEIGEDSPYYNDLKMIESEALRVKGIVRNLLDFARPKEPRKTHHNINDLINSTLPLVSQMVQSRNVTIKTDLMSGLPDIPIDANQIKQVFVNVINNACLSMQEKSGILKIKSEKIEQRGKKDGFIQILFQDNGCGISNDKLHNIFEPFFSTRGEKGSGLGLAISYGIIKNHNGEILVESEVDRGSKFLIKLPLLTE